MKLYAYMRIYLLKICLKLLRFYKFCFSCCFGMNCRFYPTCSDYSYEAFSTFGIINGFFLTVKRLCRCHPFCLGGEDLLPKTSISQSIIIDKSK